MSTANRPRPSSQLPKAPTALSPTCVIADTVVLTGAHLITISANVIIHPRARINSTYGPVTIDEGCIVSEKALIGLTSAAETDSNNSNSEPPTVGVVLEPDVVVEPAAVVEGSKIGQGSTLEAGSRVGAGAILGQV